MKHLYSALLLIFININSQELKISIIVPCHFKHIKHLPSLLKNYEDQTVMPDEVVIAISEANKADQNALDNVLASQCKFPVRYIVSNEVRLTGRNKNEACKIAIGDIFVINDADDIPLPNRLETIKYFFNTYPEVEHLSHLFYYKDDAHSSLPKKLEEIPFYYPKNYNDAFQYAKQFNNQTFHNGNIAIRRKVFEKLQWSPSHKQDEDREFNLRAFPRCKTIVVLEPLITYIWQNSSWL